MPIKPLEHKPCNGPLCQGKVRPRSEFYPRRKGGVAVNSQCKACNSFRFTGKDGYAGWLPISQVRWIFEEFVGRCGMMEGERRSGVSRMTLVRVLTGRPFGSNTAGVRKVRRSTVRKVMLALIEAREQGYSKSDAWEPANGQDPESGEVIRFDPRTVDASMKWARRNGLTFPTLEARMHAWGEWSELRRSGVDDLERVVMRYGGRIDRRDPVGRDVLAEAG